jgi:hypothetical protein
MLANTQRDFVDLVIARTSTSLPRDEVVARAQVAYAAFVRQLHAGIYLQSRFSVRWTIKRDLHGIDLIVTEGGLEYGIDMYIDTARSRDWRHEKAFRHPPADIPIFQLRINRASTKSLRGKSAMATIRTICIGMRTLKNWQIGSSALRA